MSASGAQERRIEGHAWSVGKLLADARFTIDFYQRGYAWGPTQVRELVDDLTSKFLDFYREDHERKRVSGYGHYFLGSIVISNRDGRKFIVDGQQRLTTLTLLLMHLHHLSKGRADVAPVVNLIYSAPYGEPEFNLEVESRVACMKALLNGDPFDLSEADESVKNLVERFGDLKDEFPESLHGKALPYFVDWLRGNVHLVEIEAYRHDDAYTIFETMNDRGLKLSFTEMLKGYLLANVEGEAQQRKVDDLWNSRIQQLRGGDDKGGDDEFFKAWFRGRYATSIQQRSGGDAGDYERIGAHFHRWVRDKRDQFGLTNSGAFVRFVERDFAFYSKWAIRLRAAMADPVPGLETVYFNAERDFTTQELLLLSVLDPDDPPETAERKVRLVADYVDIWLTRQTWAYKSTAQNLVKHSMFALAREIRGLSVKDLAGSLRKRLDDDPQTFAKRPNLQLNHQNKGGIRHILMRLSHWVDRACGLPTHVADYRKQARQRPYEIEHLWPDHPELFRQWFTTDEEFEDARNRLGGLVLLHRGPNQSLGDKPYEEKRDTYVAQGQCLLTRSLHPLAYKNNPPFMQFIERTALPFKAIDTLDPAAQQQRRELYIRIAEWVWNPSRLDLDGEKDPQPEPIGEPDDEVESGDGAEVSVAKAVRFEKRRAFWTKVVARSKATGGLHGDKTPGKYHWIGARSGGFWWNYGVNPHDCRIELWVSTWERPQNKLIFDHIHANRTAIEQSFGGPLEWHRLDDYDGSKIRWEIPGGWLDESTYDATIEKLVDGMARLHKALSAPALAAKKAVLDGVGG